MVEKCDACRSSKIKCLPEERIWDEKEEQKCSNCLKSGRACGPGVNPPLKPRAATAVRVQEDPDASSLAAPQIESQHFEDHACLFCAKRARISKDSEELQKGLNELDAILELVNHIHIAFEEMRKRFLGFHAQSRLEYHDLSDLHQRTSQDLISRLIIVEALGDRAYSAGENELAENTYIRILDIYRRQPLPAAPRIRSLLTKMASFYKETGQPFRAEKCWQDILKLRDSTGRPQCTEEEAWKGLAASLPETSKIISDTFRSLNPDLFSPLHLGTPSLQLESPFPPIHRMIQNEYSSAPCHKEFAYMPLLDSTSSLNGQSSISGCSRNLSEIIQRTPDSDLTAKDILNRTALYLAAFHKQEDAGRALITRVKTLSMGALLIEMSARDVFGQTVLGIAILSQCSFDFIKVLIEHKATIDPGPLPYPPTPLQAACMTENAEVVNLLLEQGADINHVFRGNPKPLDIACHNQNDQIRRLISERSKVADSPIPALPIQQDSLHVISANKATTHASLPRIDATRINIFQEDDQVLFGQFNPTFISYPIPEPGGHLDERCEQDAMKE